ncbi:MAG: patatin-like phospholipase family protein [Epsilonproteobacteria bacterium]|nr:MAG: patatin-like phospholipase family protein [Campylobacterota bacterium]RLA67086.1 MAG: patatin-like phospholipase family protein [Campylobacterota bacterium]
MNKKLGLVLTGGGARGAYQAGVLSAVAEIAHEEGMKFPFPIITGMSAGAINAACLASSIEEDYRKSFASLENLWATIHCENIYKTDAPSIFKNMFKWLFVLTTGGIDNQGVNLALFNTRPLRKFLKRNADFKKIQQRIQEEYFLGMGITALSYETGHSTTFFQGCKQFMPWDRHQRIGVRSKLGISHVMASSAIPLLFPSEGLNKQFYGDGSLRNLSPLSPAIHLGAEKLFVIGVTNKNSARPSKTLPTLGKIMSVLMDSIFLDSIDYDLERLERVNQLVGSTEESFKKIEAFVINPSENIGQIAKEEEKHLKKFIKFLVNRLGSNEEVSDLVSYILFEPSFTQRLIELGKKDARNQKEEIKKFIMDG